MVGRTNGYIHTYIHTYIQTWLAFNMLMWGSLRFVPITITKSTNLLTSVGLTHIHSINIEHLVLCKRYPNLSKCSVEHL